MLGVGAAPRPGASGRLGGAGPAPGIRPPAKIELQTAERGRVRPLRDGAVQVTTGKRIGRAIVTTQQTPEPSTPLKARSEALRTRQAPREDAPERRPSPAESRDRESRAEPIKGRHVDLGA